MGNEVFLLQLQQIYENGLQFRTPEAITAAGTFRASHYLRAMAIWAIYLCSERLSASGLTLQMFLPFCITLLKWCKPNLYL